MKKSEIDQHYSEAVRLGLLEIERRARVLLRKRKTLDEFVMCMGSCFFTDRKGEIVQPAYPWAKSLLDFLCEWDDYLKLTGQPMRFTADGPVRKNW